VTDLALPDGRTLASTHLRRPMIVADDAHVTYRVFASGKRFNARDDLVSLRAFRGGRGLREVPALRGVSFTAAEGETIGVVGHNGSGKSTLFRAMSGLIPTSEGSIWARDRPVLLGVNAALVPELSGENNIKLGLLAMGFTPEEAAAQVDEIADFAELNEFIHHPMRTYSSGMGARLRFAIASAKAHSILLIDEALAVGDKRFRRKSEDRIRDLRDTAGLVMIVSHSAGSLKETCERVLWIHKGELRADGPTTDVLADYAKWTKNPASVAVGAASGAKGPQRAAGARAKPDSSLHARSPIAANEADLPVTAATAVLDGRQASMVYGAHATDSSARHAARRARQRAASRGRHRRRIMTVIVTGAATVLAIATGAGLALAANMSASPGPRSTSAVAAAASDTPTPTLPVISSFEAGSKTVECATDDAKAKVKLSWKVDSAALVAVVAGSVTTEEAELTPKTVLPTEMKDHGMAFSCDKSKQAYTLVAENAGGDRVSSVITVTRAEPTVAPSAPPQQQQTIPQAPRPAPVTTPTQENSPTPSSPAPAPQQTTTAPDPGETEGTGGGDSGDTGGSGDSGGTGDTGGAGDTGGTGDTGGSGDTGAASDPDPSAPAQAGG